MAIKSSRPEDEDAPGLVVFVARTLADLRKARGALEEAGLPLDLPAAAEAAVEAGQPVPLRVPPPDLRRGQEAIDRAFPRESVGLPAEEDEGVPTPAEVAARLAAERDLDDGDGDGDGEAPRSGPLLDEATYEPPPARRGVTPQHKLEASAGKLLFVAAVSLAVPGIGALFGLFAAAVAPWLLGRLVHARGRRLAIGALTTGLVSVVWNVWLGYQMFQNSGGSLLD